MRAAFAGCPTRTSTAKTTRPMPDASATRIARVGLVANERGILVARTDYPAESDIDLSRGALVANALSGDQTSGAWLDERRRKSFIAVAVPLRASLTATPQGALVAAYAVDDSLAQEIKQATTTDVVFFA